MRRKRHEIMAETADLLACLASQPHRWAWFIATIPGDWSQASRRLADQTQRPVALYGVDSWRQLYAESEARLRAELRHRPRRRRK